MKIGETDIERYRKRWRETEREREKERERERAGGESMIDMYVSRAFKCCFMGS